MENLLISPRVASAWKAYCPIAIRELLAKYPDLIRQELPEEQFRIKPDDSGQIFVKVRDLEISMNVPSGEWKLKP